MVGPLPDARPDPAVHLGHHLLLGACLLIDVAVVSLSLELTLPLLLLIAAMVPVHVHGQRMEAVGVQPGRAGLVPGPVPAVLPEEVHRRRQGQDRQEAQLERHHTRAREDLILSVAFSFSSLPNHDSLLSPLISTRSQEITRSVTALTCSPPHLNVVCITC